MASGWFFIAGKKNNSTSDDTSIVLSEPSTPEASDPNPFSTSESSVQIPDVADNAQNTTDNVQTDVSENTNSVTTTDAEIDIASVAVDPLSDEEFIELRALLKNDVGLRLEILDQFRYSTDPARSKQLAALLGDYDNPEIVQTAAELARSGEPLSQSAGLNLLNRLQPHNDDARDIAIDLLSSQTDPATLVATMNVLATPAKTATAAQRQLINDNVGLLASHHEPSVRAHSLALIGRWDKNSPANREALTKGLSDSDAKVRARATHGLKNIENPDDNMINGLLAIAENKSEKRTTRYAAIGALSNMTLPSQSVRRFRAAEYNVNRKGS